MQQELPLYIFIRNSVILCVLFFIISIAIIEHRKVKLGENSLFNEFSKKKSLLHDYKGAEIHANKNETTSYQFSESRTVAL